jgi:hypothetical protein
MWVLTPLTPAVSTPMLTGTENVRAKCTASNVRVLEKEKIGINITLKLTTHIQDATSHPIFITFDGSRDLINMQSTALNSNIDHFGWVSPAETEKRFFFI